LIGTPHCCRNCEPPTPWWPGVRELVSSRPGEAANRLRFLFYQRLDLSEPNGGIVEPPLSTVGLEIGAGVQAFTVSAETAPDATVHLRRHRTDVHPVPTGPTHLVVHADHPIREHRTNADILFTERTDNLTALFAQAPGCRIVVSTTSGTAMIRGREHPVRLHGCGPLLAASALFALDREPPADIPIVADGRAYSGALSS
jgi:hypothetical protein